MFTTKAVKIALFAVALAAPSLASAKPRHVAVLDFDGPRALADAGKQAVVAALSNGYDLVSSKNWLDAKAAAARKAHGPSVWAKASKAAGVDAVVDGWVQDEGRNKVLTLVVTDASDGNEGDQLTIKLTSKGFNGDITSQITKGLEDRFEWIEPVNGSNPDPLPTYKQDTHKVGAKRTDESDDISTDDRRSSRRDDDRRSSRRRDDDRDDRRADRRDDRDDDRKSSRRRDDDRAERADDRRELGTRDDRRGEGNDDVTEKRVATAEPKTKTEKETALLNNVFAPPTEEEIIVNPKRAHVARPTIKAMVSGGGYMNSRTLFIAAENQEGVTQYAGVPNKGLQVGATFYPFPTKKIDGIQSGIGFSFGAGHSLGSTVTFDDGDQVGDYVINQSSWDLGIHYRVPLGETFAIDGAVGYGQSGYKLEDAPMTFEVPDTSYQFLSAGGHLDMKITDNSSVGFGAKYLYLLGTGDLSSTDWYGPGKASGWNLETNFVIPLPKDLYIEGQLSYQRIKTSFDGVGQITEQESVSEAVDSSIGGTVKVGIKF